MNVMKYPMPKRGTAASAIENFWTPTAAMIHPVRVVPMFAPMMDADRLYQREESGIDE